MIFQQPNFFGCLEPAPDLAAAANDGGALPIAHVDLISLGVLEAPGNYGCALAIGEGQSAGNYMSYGGPHYGFLAARDEHIRRLPGPDRRRDGRHRGRARLSSSRCRRASSTSGARRRPRTSPPTRPCSRSRAWCTSRCSARRGCARRGRPAWRSPPYAKERLEARGLELAVSRSGQRSRSLPCASDGTRAEAIRAAREHGVNPGYPLGRDYPGPRRRAARRRDRAAHRSRTIDRPASDERSAQRARS